MRRLHGVLTAIALTGLADPAGAADITRVLTGAEPGTPFEVDLSARWDRIQERATISHESGTTAAGVPGGLVGEAERINYQRTTNAVIPRIAVGIFHDLELHAEMPYVLGDETSWWYGTLSGNSSAGTGSWNVASPGIDVQGQPCAGVTCQLFPVDPKQTVYKGGRAGDLTAGIAWGVFHNRKDPTGPTWLVGLDVTFPTAMRYEPAKDRITTADSTYWSSPYSEASKPGPFGEKIWKWDLYTALSRRMGPLDPYVKAHVQAQYGSSSTYSNCDAADTLTPLGQMNLEAPANCRTWGGADSGATLPWIFGMTFGTEVIVFEDPADALSLDLRVWADYKTKHRFYNELTDMTGKIHTTEGYAEAGGLAGLYLKASRYVTLKATATLATRSPHWLTGDSPGKNGDWPPIASNGTTVDPAQMNPNFDWRYDAPGRRFRISEVSVFALSFAGVLTF